MSQSIYRIYVDVEDCATYQFNAYKEIDYWDEYLAKNFDGKSLPPNWKMPRYELGAPKKPLHDFVHGESPAPFVSERAKNALEKVTGSDVQFWYLGDIRGKPYYILNVVTVLDCLDLAKSRILYAADGRLLSLREAVFDVAKVPVDKSVFKVPQDTGLIYATKTFVDCVREHQLTGVGFEHPDDIGVSAPKDAFRDLPLRASRMKRGR